jgi:hypothetical protein
MKRWNWLIAFVFFVSLTLTGCAPKSAEDVVADLGEKVEKMDSYKGSGKMTLLTGEKPLEYNVEVWYKQPDYYRIMLKNEDKKISQIVVRNDDGVFVLTPHLNKTFRFQSSWPQNQGQIYLLQTLAQSITDDRERKFTAAKDSFVFDVTANYQNSMLARQKITLQKDSYAPKSVEVFDKHANKLVQMDFSSFEYDWKFSDSAFQTQSNMTGWLHPDLSGEDNLNASISDDSSQTLAETESAAGDKQTSTPETQQDDSFGVIEPTYLPGGVAKQDVSEFRLGEHKAVMLRYGGDYHFTLTESAPETNTVSAMNGEPVDLGYTVGVLLGEEQRTLVWTNDGVEFKLTTAELPLDEMVKVAQSVQGQMGK